MQSLMESSSTTQIQDLDVERCSTGCQIIYFISDKMELRKYYVVSCCLIFGVISTFIGFPLKLYVLVSSLLFPFPFFGFNLISSTLKYCYVHFWLFHTTVS